MKPVADKNIENLLDLDGLRFVIDDHFGLWVKFEVKQVVRTQSRPHGTKYSLSLHDKVNNRILGFDNAHRINLSHTTYDHWHTRFNQILFYDYKNAAKLLEDFWQAVEVVIKYLKIG